MIEGKVYQLASSHGVVKIQELIELYSDQKETDTRIKYAVMLGYKLAVGRTPDNDIFFNLLHHAHSINLTIDLDTESGKHRQPVCRCKGSRLMHHTPRSLRLYWGGCNKHI